MFNATFAAPDLTTFCNLDDLGLVVVGQHRDPGQAVLECRVVEADDLCRSCGSRGRPLGTVARRLAHEPFGARPTTLVVRIRRYRCAGCARFWLQDTSAAAEPRAKISRGGLAWALRALVVDHLSMSRVAAGLGVAWHTANDAVLSEGHRLLINDPARFDGVRVIGVDEHVWRHTRFGDKYVTVIIDLTPVADGTGTSRLLDMVPGRSKQVFKTWLAERPNRWRENIEVVAMDGFTGFKTATTEELPDAVAVMDPFHVVCLAGDALDQSRRRVQQQLHGHRGCAGDRLYSCRRTLHTGVELLTDRQWARVTSLFDNDDHIDVEVTWAVYQRLLSTYRNPDRSAGRHGLSELIASLRTGVPAALVELQRLGRTLNKRASDILAYFDPALPTDPPRRSTAAWNTCAVQHSDFATSKTTSHDPSSKAAASDPHYTLNCEEPDMGLRDRSECALTAHFDMGIKRGNCYLTSREGPQDWGRPSMPALSPMTQASTRYSRIFCVHNYDSYGREPVSLTTVYQPD